MQKTALILVAIVFGSLFVGSVSAAGDGGITYYDDIPDMNGNQTATNETLFWNGEAVQSINPNGSPITISRYAPTTLRLIYATATSYWVNASVATSTDHFESQKSDSMTVDIGSMGFYQFRFNVLYSEVVNQSITLMVRSGSEEQVDYFPIACQPNKGFTLDVVVNADTEPHYPTAEELNEADRDFDSQMMANMTQQNNERDLKESIINAVIIISIVTIAIIVILVAKRQNHMHIRQLRSETYGWRKQ